jgi:hypothetical protein
MQSPQIARAVGVNAPATVCEGRLRGLSEAASAAFVNLARPFTGRAGDSVALPPQGRAGFADEHEYEEAPAKPG